MNSDLQALSTESDFSISLQPSILNEASLAEMSQQENVLGPAKKFQSDLDDSPDIVTACYLCHGQCANFGVHGNGVRPCARGVTSILERCRKGRSRAGSTRPGAGIGQQVQ